MSENQDFETQLVDFLSDLIILAENTWMFCKNEYRSLLRVGIVKYGVSVIIRCALALVAIMVLLVGLSVAINYVLPVVFIIFIGIIYFAAMFAYYIIDGYQWFESLFLACIYRDNLRRFVIILILYSFIKFSLFCLRMAIRCCWVIYWKYKKIRGEDDSFEHVGLEDEFEIDDTPFFAGLWANPDKPSELPTKPLESQKLDETVEARPGCVVCLANRRQVLVLPCRHLCICPDCAMTLRNQTEDAYRVCPLCRFPIAHTLECYV